MTTTATTKTVRALAGAVAMAATLGFASLAQAQTAAAPSPSTAPANTWVKVCGDDNSSKKRICFTQRELRTDTGQFLATAGVREVDGEAARSCSFRCRSPC
ncbi:hypothetical protein [Methylobrevis pamukkalensis]|uniref:Uncharacterized protein n=1 Tax=Methylobrevis pamukkalensis TaxID=1439726 RepID=A0A1E3H5K1_9HYPH|nr:hypothetical protein [Methylobrevis pamukkalensis]ODN70801.1 hypothetical protein A6302_01848 [Methylobrevis pamukkalensis]